MDPLASYVLPIRGMGVGMHNYMFVVDEYFLSHYEQCPYKQAQVSARVFADKQENLIALNIEIKGKVHCPCDRCTAPLNLPIKGAYQVYLKTKSDVISKTDDVIFIDFNQTSFDISDLLYDLFLITIPLQKTYDCENEIEPPCDNSVLDKLDEGLDSKTESGSSIWDELKKQIT